MKTVDFKHYISLLLIANLALDETVNKKRISLQRRDVPIKREIRNAIIIF